MLRTQFDAGRAAALARFKVANAALGYAAPTVSNPMANATAAAMPATTSKPPMAPAAPVAAGAPKSNIIG